MNKLIVRMSIADILLVEAMIKKYMQENNIKNIDQVDTNVIQQRYDEIMKLEIWKNPEGLLRVRCPICSHELQENNYCDYCALPIKEN